MSGVDDLYEPLIVRDLDAIPEAVRTFAAGRSDRELFDAVCRFAIGSYAPSQHARHALLACHAAWDLRERLRERWTDLMIECARYSAGSRIPWSEPPIPDPPKIDDAESIDRSTIETAIASGDRLLGERWLAARMQDPDFASAFFDVASADVADLGHKLIVAAAVWDLAALYPGVARFAILRIAVWEWTAAPPAAMRDSAPADEIDTAMRLLDDFRACNGDAISFHRIAHFDAALRAAAVTGNDAVARRVSGHLLGEVPDCRGNVARSTASLRDPVYPFARDYAELLQAWAIAARWHRRFDPFNSDDFIRAAQENLETMDSFEDWSFA